MSGLQLYSEGGDCDSAIPCAHCGEKYCHPAKAEWIGKLHRFEYKDNIWGDPVGFLGCEMCPGITGVWLVFCKGNTWLHTEALKAF